MCPSRISPGDSSGQRHAALQAVADAVCLRRPPADLFSEVSALLRPFLPFDLISVALWNSNQRFMEMHSWEESTQRYGPLEIAAEDSAVKSVWRNQTPTSIDNLTEERHFRRGPRWLRDRDIRSYAVFPLTNFREKLGAIGFGSKLSRAFSEQEIQFLNHVAEIVALGIDTAFPQATLIEELGRLRLRLDRIEAARALRTQEPKAEFASEAGFTAVKAVKAAGSLLSRLISEPAPYSPLSFSASEALKESEPLLTAYFKASRVGLYILDREFRYLAINENMAEMNGVPAPAHIGKSVREVLGDFAELAEPPLRRALATGQPVADFEISFLSPNRTDPGHWIRHYIPIKNSAGEVTQIGVITVDVTERKRLEESLRGVSESLRQEKKRHHVLAEVSRLLETKWDVKQAFPQVSAFLRRVLRQEYAALSLHEKGTGQLVPEAIDFPLRKIAAAGREIGSARGSGSKAMQDRSSLILNRGEMERLDPAIAASLNSEGLKSLCCVPLLRPKGPLGVLVLGSTRPDAFHTDDLTLLNQVAAQLAIALENAASAREVARLKQKLSHERRYLEGEPHIQIHFEDIIGKSPAIQQVLEQVAIVAESDATVLLLGETGTGKGLIARAIHRISKRKDRGFITLNCAAIPTGLLESELFGHEKGAFTGAVSQKIGRLEVADQGTLFLDEIGEIPLDLQPKLLRVLQDYEFERLGGTRTIKVDLRLIAATNRDLAKSVSLKEFRSDLFYRLNVFPIRLPSLRERREDIPLLVRHFVRKFSRASNRDIQTIPSETMDALIHWHWPGNIRELENFIERSVILTEGTALRAPLTEFQAETSDSKEKSLEETEREHIIRVLRETGGAISGPSGAARRLGLKRTTLQSKMRRLGIKSEDYLNRKR